MTRRQKAVATVSKNQPSLEEQALTLDSLQRYVERRRPVSVEIARGEGDIPRVGPNTSDHSGWAVRENDAVGGASVSFGQTQLRHMTRVAMGLPETAESATNSMLAAVEAVRPENEIEGQLAVQMSTTHQAAMQALGRACQTDAPAIAETMGNLANKLMRTYTQQVEALAKLRRGGEQTVRVEHVHVYQGGQAIVGNVTGPAARGYLENGRQPHELTGPAALAVQADPSLLRPDAGRDPMPVASREREDRVSQARRTQGSAEWGLSDRAAHGRGGRVPAEVPGRAGSVARAADRSAVMQRPTTGHQHLRPLTRH